jgi:hypothetical protein
MLDSDVIRSRGLRREINICHCVPVLLLLHCITLGRAIKNQTEKWGNRAKREYICYFNSLTDISCVHHGILFC